MSTTIDIRMAELSAADASTIFLATGVGSCVIVVLYDHLLRIGGMAHAILPHARPSEFTLSNQVEDGKRFEKYTDRAIDTLIDELMSLGCAKEHIVAKLIGGARMFSLLDSNEHESIGTANILSARERLAYHHISIETEVVGGTVGRNVRFDCATGLVEITTKV